MKTTCNAVVGLGPGVRGVRICRLPLGHDDGEHERLTKPTAEETLTADLAAPEDEDRAICECGHEAKWHGPLVRWLTDATYCRVRIGRVPYEECDCTEFRAAVSLPAQQRPAPESGAADEVIERAGQAGFRSWRSLGSADHDERWRDVARAVLAAAQPAPRAETTVSVLDELLAEMRALAVAHEQDGSRRVALGLRQAGRVVEAARQRMGGER